MGYNLLDKKKHVLAKEMLRLVSRIDTIKNSIDNCFKDAYLALAKVNTVLGVEACKKLVESIKIEDGLNISRKAIMGIELVSVKLNMKDFSMPYDVTSSNSQVDMALLMFYKLKCALAELAELENNIYRLARAIKKVEKRTNALKNIIIPQSELNLKYIVDVLEEREREEFSRLKIIKNNLNRDGV